jgi:hypothetical protein
MTADEFIKYEISVWGEDYVDNLLDRGYTPVQLVMYGKLRWWWKLDRSLKNPPLTQACLYATLPASRSVVSPVSAD